MSRHFKDTLKGSVAPDSVCSVQTVVADALMMHQTAVSKKFVFIFESPRIHHLGDDSGRLDVRDAR